MLKIIVMKKERPEPLDSFERLQKELDFTADAATATMYKDRWLKYQLLPRWGGGDIVEYTSILDESHYLTTQFAFINGSDPKGEWRKKAQEYASGIAESLVLAQK